MATSKNGLKTLWVPGKNPNKKGKIETTKKPVSYNKAQKKNEQWTLGGSKGMETLIICDAQLGIMNGVLPSTSKNDIDAIDVLVDSKQNSITGADDQNQKINIDEDSICSFSIEEIDSKEKNQNEQVTNSENEKYEKLVTCLYYTLNLCECSIS